jgi:hypothetical protein
MIIDLNIGVWEDEFGKHIRVSDVDAGISITLDIQPVEESQHSHQSEVAVALLVGFPDLVGEALARTAREGWDEE